jgi:hypothetical protein
MKQISDITFDEIIERGGAEEFNLPIRDITRCDLVTYNKKEDHLYRIKNTNRYDSEKYQGIISEVWK